jgi:hypothetical protein
MLADNGDLVEHAGGAQQLADEVRHVGQAYRSARLGSIPLKFAQCAFARPNPSTSLPKG